MLGNRAIVTITRKLSKLPDGPHLYQGVSELADYGYTFIEISVPYGCKDFPSTPYMVTVDCESTLCEIRHGKWPLMTITEWEPMQYYYIWKGVN